MAIYVGDGLLRGIYKSSGQNWDTDPQIVASGWSLDSLALSDQQNVFVAVSNRTNLGVVLGANSTLVYWGSRKVQTPVSAP